MGREDEGWISFRGAISLIVAKELLSAADVTIPSRG